MISASIRKIRCGRTGEVRKSLLRSRYRRNKPLDAVVRRSGGASPTICATTKRTGPAGPRVSGGEAVSIGLETEFRKVIDHANLQPGLFLPTSPSLISVWHEPVCSRGRCHGQPRRVREVFRPLERRRARCPGTAAGKIGVRETNGELSPSGRRTSTG